MTKSEIKEKINAIPMEMLKSAALYIERSNPINEFSRNCAYVNRRTYGNDVLSIRIEFTSRATKENILNVYYAILDQIIIRYSMEAMRAIDAEYTPEWYAVEEPEQPEEKPARKTYTWTEGHAHEETTSAHAAMEWHRMGRRITVWGHRPDGSQYHVRIPGATQPEPEDKNREHCKHIAHELEAYADGQVYRCPECGEEVRMPDDVGDKYRCPHCHNVADMEDYEQLSVYDFLSDLYDIELRVGMDGDYRSCKIMVACGGPNIYIDTADAMVKLYWWSDRAEYPLSYDARDAVDAFVEEWRDCR